MTALARRERPALLGLVGASAIVHAGLGFLRPTPLVYPDEYLYTAMARSIASTGLPRVRGSFPHFPSLLGPYLMAPAWLIHDVDVAYRVALAWDALWFSLAAIPAFALARRIGVSPRGSLLVALFALLIPDAVYTTNLLSEPFAYPVFLTTVLVAVETITEPTRRRQILLVFLMLALCLLRFEFVVFPVAYLFAALAASGWSPRAVARRQRLVTAGLALAIAVALAIGVERLLGYYTRGQSVYTLHLGTVSWFGLDLFVLLIAAGWVVIPGACLGFARLMRGTTEQQAFAALALALLASLLAVAAPFGPAQGRVYERYFFYAIPLVCAAFVWASESLDRTRRYAAIAYAAAAAGLLVPMANGIHGAADDMSPTLLGLGAIAGNGNGATLAWAVLLAAAAVVIGLRVGGRSLPVLLALAIIAGVGVLGTKSLLEFTGPLGERLNISATIPRLHAPANTALVTSPVTNRWLLMKTLFWNPNITRVLVLGARASTDGFNSTAVRFQPGRGLVAGNGRPAQGPFAVDTDTFIAAAPGSSNGTPPSTVSRAAPRLLLFGWGRGDGYLETVSWLYAVASRAPVTVTLGLSSSNGRKRMSIDCGQGPRLVAVGAHVSQVRLQAQAERELACRISLVEGLPVDYHDRTVSVRARVRLHVGGRSLRVASSRSTERSPSHPAFGS